MVKILFVCHGNICRSPMGEFVMKDLVKKAGLETEFSIASAALCDISERSIRSIAHEGGRIPLDATSGVVTIRVEKE